MMFLMCLVICMGSLHDINVVLPSTSKFLSHFGFCHISEIFRVRYKEGAKDATIFQRNQSAAPYSNNKNGLKKGGVNPQYNSKDDFSYHQYRSSIFHHLSNSKYHEALNEANANPEANVGKVTSNTVTGNHQEIRMESANGGHPQIKTPPDPTIHISDNDTDAFIASKNGNIKFHNNETKAVNKQQYSSRFVLEAFNKSSDGNYAEILSPKEESYYEFISHKGLISFMHSL